MSSDVTTFLGQGSRFEGRLTFEGTVRIEGEYGGEIVSEGELVVAEGARVKAELHVGTLELHGDLIGNVIAKKDVSLISPARLKGNITTPALAMDPGVVFDGGVTMTRNQASADPSRASLGDDF